MLQNVWEALRFASTLGLALTAILGAALGSFANVVIYRLPRGESLLKPASHCPQCEAPIPWRYNLPIAGYFILRGRTACCSQTLSFRYPVIELLGALIPTALYFLYGWDSRFIFSALWMLILVVIAAIDLEHYRIPNALTAMGLLFSLLWMVVAPERSWLAAGAGLAFGFGTACLMMLTGRIARGGWRGLGDLKLSAVLGFTFGAVGFFVLFFSAALSALIYGLVRRSLPGKEGKREERIPMAPFFALGAWIAICCGDALLRWYWQLLP